VAIELYRIDDRLIHGQVVVGWGQPLDIGFFVLADDEVSDCDWEQELYRLGVPPGVDVHFDSVDAVVAHFDDYVHDPRRGMLLTRDIETMQRLASRISAIRAVNLGGLHHRAGREQKLRYVFLTNDEVQALRDLAARGVSVTAQDVPASRPVSLDDVLNGRGPR
jgi:PTS system mannose-specific IIB component/fructoselysine and glucoselysine-specific PTS system IIB component